MGCHLYLNSTALAVSASGPTHHGTEVPHTVRRRARVSALGGRGRKPIAYLVSALIMPGV